MEKLLRWGGPAVKVGDGVILFLLLPQVLGLWEKTKLAVAFAVVVLEVGVASWLRLPCHPFLTDGLEERLR